MKRVDKSNWKNITGSQYIGIEVNSFSASSSGRYLRMSIIQLKPGKFCLHDPYEPIHLSDLENREKRVMSIEELLVRPAEVFGIKVFEFYDSDELNDWLTYKYE